MAAVSFFAECDADERAPHIHKVAAHLHDSDERFRRAAVLFFTRCSTAERSAFINGISAFLDDISASPFDAMEPSELFQLQPTVGLRIAYGRPAHPEHGLRIRIVLPGSSAEAAGITAEDYINQLDGKTMLDSAAFVSAIKRRRPGDVVQAHLHARMHACMHACTHTLTLYACSCVNVVLSHLSGTLREVQLEVGAVGKTLDKVHMLRPDLSDSGGGADWKTTCTSPSMPVSLQTSPAHTHVQRCMNTHAMDGNKFWMVQGALGRVEETWSRSIRQQSRQQGNILLHRP